MEKWMAKFVTYENKRNPHITIHKNGCNQIGKNGGAGEGKYTGFADYMSAEKYATTTELPKIDCSFCNPHNAE